MSDDIEYPSSKLVRDLHQHELESLDIDNAANRSGEHVHEAFALGAAGATGLTALAGTIAPGLWAFPAAYTAWEAGNAFAARSAAKHGKWRAEQIEQMRRDTLPPELTGLQHASHEGRAIAAPDRQGKGAANVG